MRLIHVFSHAKKSKNVQKKLGIQLPLIIRTPTLNHNNIWSRGVFTCACINNPPFNSPTRLLHLVGLLKDGLLSEPDYRVYQMWFYLKMEYHSFL